MRLSLSTQLSTPKTNNRLRRLLSKKNRKCDINFDKGFDDIAASSHYVIVASPCLLGKAALLLTYAPLSPKIFDFSGALPAPALGEEGGKRNGAGDRQYYQICIKLHGNSIKVNHCIIKEILKIEDFYKKGEYIWQKRNNLKPRAKSSWIL